MAGYMIPYYLFGAYYYFSARTVIKYALTVPF